MLHLEVIDLWIIRFTIGGVRWMVNVIVSIWWVVEFQIFTPSMDLDLITVIKHLETILSIIRNAILKSMFLWQPVFKSIKNKFQMVDTAIYLHKISYINLFVLVVAKNDPLKKYTKYSKIKIFKIKTFIAKKYSNKKIILKNKKYFKKPLVFK